MKKRTVTVTFENCIRFQRSEGAPKQFSLVAPVDLLTSVLTVSRRAENKSGYQRKENRSKIRKIVKYLETDTGVLPNAITVAFDESRKGATVKFVSRKRDGLVEYGDLVVSFSNGKPGLIIDGQHRFLVARIAYPEMPIAVSGLLDADRFTQLVQFVIINNRATRVSGGHLNVLMADVAKLEGSQKARFDEYLKQLGLTEIRDADVVAYLNEKDGSFEGLLDFPDNPYGFVSSTELARLVAQSRKNGVLSKATRDGSLGTDSEEIFDNLCAGIRQRFKRLWETEVGQRKKVVDRKIKKKDFKQRLLHSATLNVLVTLVDENMSAVSSLGKWKDDPGALVDLVSRFLKNISEADIKSLTPDNTTEGRRRLRDSLEGLLIG